MKKNILNVKEPLAYYQIDLFKEGRAFSNYYLDKSGEKEFNFRELCPGIPNTSYLTHDIHPYPAKFIPQIPHYLIKNLTKPGEYILDPFCGSGTALVEASLLGRHSYGIDINPLGQLITEVKTTPIPISHRQFAKLVEKFKYAMKYYKGKALSIDFPNKMHWFDKKVQLELEIILGSLEQLKLELPEAIYKFFKVCVSSVVRKVANADPKISKPFVSKHMREKMKNGERNLDTFRYLEKIIDDYSQRVLAYTNHMHDVEYYTGIMPKVTILKNSDARSIQLQDNTIDLIVTSPPYANAQEYLRSIKLELFWLGMVTDGELLHLKRQLVGTETIPAETYGKLQKFGIKDLDRALEKIYEVDPRRSYIVYKYFIDMKKSISENFRVLRPNKHFCILVGDNVIRKVPVYTHKYLVNIAEDVGFRTMEVGYDRIKSRGLSPKRHHTAGLIEVEWLMVFKKL
jgi:DNA modification methylase